MGRRKRNGERTKTINYEKSAKLLMMAVSYCPCDKCYKKDSCQEECDYFVNYTRGVTEDTRAVNYLQFIGEQEKRA